MIKQPHPYNIPDKKKAASHLSFLLFSLLCKGLVSITAKGDPHPFALILFILLFTLVVSFVYPGGRLFAGLNSGKNPGEMPRIILFRCVIFLVACPAESLFLFIFLLLLTSLRREHKLREENLVFQDHLHTGSGSINGIALNSISYHGKFFLFNR